MVYIRGTLSTTHITIELIYLFVFSIDQDEDEKDDEFLGKQQHRILRK